MPIPNIRIYMGHKYAGNACIHIVVSVEVVGDYIAGWDTEKRLGHILRLCYRWCMNVCTTSSTKVMQAYTVLQVFHGGVTCVLQVPVEE